MTQQFKKIAFLTPRADLDQAAFRHHWQHVHGPIVGSAPDYCSWRWRYVQDHPLTPGPGTDPFGFSGVAEFWLPAHSPREEEDYALSSTYREHIAPDEDRFIDKSRTLSLRAREQVLIRGHGAVKLMRLGRWVSGVTDEQLSALLSELSGAGLTAALRDWRVDHVIPDSIRLPGAQVASGLAYDYVETLWFDSPAEALRHLASTEPWRAALFGATGTSLFVREHVFFDNGAYCGPPIGSTAAP